MAAWAVPFLSFASAAHPWTPDIEVTRRHQLPELAPNAAVEVYAMDKPLSGLPIPLMEATQGWHSGLAFRSGSSFWYLEYYAKDGMKSAVLPEIDGSSLVWNNTAILGLKMNTSVQIEAYWTRALFLGVVNGSVYNACEGKYWKIMLNASHPFGFDFAEDHRIAWPNNRTLAADLEALLSPSDVHGTHWDKNAR
ncbi:hypothetical protein AB1Y20_020523 [Prymnesium parvum]|uniref:Uncharacterized protein n=1 Tax=Prymnesium parvum TaxID=97485 RepID=A0AB34JXF2_PRYPA